MALRQAEPGPVETPLALECRMMCLMQRELHLLLDAHPISPLNAG